LRSVDLPSRLAAYYEHMADKEKAVPKKKYAPPQLTVYGTIIELTKTVGLAGSQDNPLHTPLTKTSLT
jgi:hypothetical protein